MICLPSLTFSHQRKKEMSINCRKKIIIKASVCTHGHNHKKCFLFIFPLRLHLKNWPPHLNFAVCQAQTKTIANRTQVYQNILRCDKNWQEDAQTSHLFDSEIMPNKRITFQKTFQKKKKNIWAIKNKGKKNINAVPLAHLYSMQSLESSSIQWKSWQKAVSSIIYISKKLISNMYVEFNNLADLKLLCMT